jgi:hypothetical protein
MESHEKVRYCAHIIMATSADETPESYQVHENVVRMEAADSEEIWDAADAYGQRDAATQNADPAARLDGKPCTTFFAGVRKVIQSFGPDIDDERLTEVTYSIYEIQGHEKLKTLAKGDNVSLDYVE